VSDYDVMVVCLIANRLLCWAFETQQ